MFWWYDIDGANFNGIVNKFAKGIYLLNIFSDQFILKVVSKYLGLFPCHYRYRGTLR